jgi:hypothetical protein
MQRVVLALPLNRYGNNVSVEVGGGWWDQPLHVTGLFIQKRSHILFPLQINIKNCCIWVTQIDNEFNNNVNVNVQVTSDCCGGCHYRETTLGKFCYGSNP